MKNKKLEIVELNKEEQQIVLEQQESPRKIFFEKYGKLILLILLILSLAVLITGVIVTVSNLSTSDQPIIKKVSIDAEISDANVTIDPSIALTDETAKNRFTNSNIFKTSGEVIVVKTIETETFTIKFYSDYTAIKIMKNNNIITRINSIDGNRYGIDEKGVINIKAETSDVSLAGTKKYSWGTVNYFSDGSAEIVDSKINVFVRNSKDINENYISDNKISYLKETKSVRNVKLNYYHDGTIQVIDGNKTYIVRSEKDLNIYNNKVTFTNKNQATIKEKVRLKDGKIIEYYTDGGAIIYDGSRTISVRRSNSIVVKNNKIYEIVDNIYVKVSKITNNGNIIYYTNGSAVINNYNGKTVYIKENSDIKFKDGKISDIGNNYEILTEERNINGDKILKFETIAIVEKNGTIAIVPKDNIIYDTDGSLKEILSNEISSNGEPIKIINNTNETIQYRLVIEKSARSTLDVGYIRYQLSVGNTYVEPKRLDSEIWQTDTISESLSVTGTNYILVDKTLEPHATDEIKVMLWTDYDTIPNTMQNKYFYGTIRIYAWKELEKENI